MTTRFVENGTDLKLLIKFLERREPPFSVTVVKGKKRSILQNSLQRLWMNEIAEQLGDRTPEYMRGFCKLSHGVPILVAENEAFAEAWETVKPLTYETKIALMMEPLDLPITRVMTTKQKKQYLDAVYDQFTEMGLQLTVPDDMGLAA